MRVPNVAERMKVAERVKEAPAHALRAVFAGVGQALLLSDRVRRKVRNGGQETSPAAQPVTGKPGAAAPTASSTATAPAAPATKPTPTPAPGPAPTAAPKPSAPPPPAAPAPPAAAPAPSAAAPGASTASREAETRKASAAEPPFPNYDELTIASLRARMRGLDVSQLRDLIKYEKAHAARADVIAMFERRISKLQNTP